MSKKSQFAVRLTAAVAIVSAFYGSLAAQTFSEWTTPANVGTTINSTANEV